MAQEQAALTREVILAVWLLAAAVCS